MLGVLLLVLVGIAVYLYSGPLPRISLKDFEKFKKIKLQRLGKTTQVLLNSDVLVLLWILHTDLLAGQTLHSSISRAMHRMPAHLFLQTKSAVHNQTDLVAALSQDSIRTNNQILCDLKQILTVTNSTGSSAQSAIKRLIERIQNEQRNRNLVASELAGTKATVLVLACLPFLGMLMSAGLGINSMRWLLGNSAGWACLLLGSSLEILGLFWVKLLINRATDFSR